MKKDLRLKKTLSREYLISLNQLIHILKSYNNFVETAVLIGSPMHSQNIIKSDLDVCIYIKKISNSNSVVRQINQILKSRKINLLEDLNYISDFGNRRFECTIKINDIIFELAFLDGNYRNKITPHLVRKDDFERHIGNLFKWGIVLFDTKNSKYKLLGKKFLPYYDERIRLERLSNIESAIIDRINRIDSFDNLSKHILKAQLLSLFVQYVFVLKKEYPYHYEKWVDKQLVKLIGDNVSLKFSSAFNGTLTKNKLLKLLSNIKKLD